MKLPKRPRDAAQLGHLVVQMATGEVPNDKEQVLQALKEAEPTGRAKSAKARAASQTPQQRKEIARKAAAARWGTEPLEVREERVEYEVKEQEEAD